MHQRRKAREVTLQVLYALDVQEIGPQEAINLFWANFDAPAEARKFASFLIEGTWENRGQIDELISGNSENWTIARMSRVADRRAYLRELLDRVADLLVEDAPIGDDDDGVEDRRVACPP